MQSVHIAVVPAHVDDTIVGSRRRQAVVHRGEGLDLVHAAAGRELPAQGQRRLRPRRDRATALRVPTKHGQDVAPQCPGVGDRAQK